MGELQFYTIYVHILVYTNDDCIWSSTARRSNFISKGSAKMSHITKPGRFGTKALHGKTDQQEGSFF